METDRRLTNIDFNICKGECTDSMWCLRYPKHLSPTPHLKRINFLSFAFLIVHISAPKGNIEKTNCHTNLTFVVIKTKQSFHTLVSFALTDLAMPIFFMNSLEQLPLFDIYDPRCENASTSSDLLSLSLICNVSKFWSDIFYAMNLLDHPHLPIQVCIWICKAQSCHQQLLFNYAIEPSLCLRE